MNHATFNRGINIADRLAQQASERPDAIAIATPSNRIRTGRYVRTGNRPYCTITFAQLSQKVDRLAAGFQMMGMKPGDRIVLLVRFGEDFIALVLALLKAGVTLVLIDPGMPREHLLGSLQSSSPTGFVAIPKVQAIVKLVTKRFPLATKNVTVGRTFGILPKPTFRVLEKSDAKTFIPPDIALDDPAAIIFTTGSTGPPKGVLYTHRTFNSQVDRLTEHYDIRPGGVDLACFPLFGLFDAVMGTTTIIPDMDPIRPADVEAARLLDAIDQWQVNQAFGSPALWKAVGRFSDGENRTCPSLKFVLSAGAPVAPQTLMSVRQMMNPEGVMYTPYGATEALPVASIESREILSETAAATEAGKGTCVGRKFAGIEWRLIAITDAPIERLEQAQQMPAGEIGELIVCGDVVSTQYVTRPEQNALHKIQDGVRLWHRLGDVGYFDDQDRFWYCGRKTHRVQLDASNVLYTEPCEAIINRHPQVNRCALVGISRKGTTQPVIVIEPMDLELHRSPDRSKKLLAELKRIAAENKLTQSISTFMIYPDRLPTDIRHNSKIFREQLQTWAQSEISDLER